jgi:hypothetical protein
VEAIALEVRKIIATRKKFIWFEKSGHEVADEEAERFNQIYY